MGKLPEQADFITRDECHGHHEDLKTTIRWGLRIFIGALISLIIASIGWGFFVERSIAAEARLSTSSDVEHTVQIRGLEDNIPTSFTKIDQKLDKIVETVNSVNVKQEKLITKFESHTENHK